MSQKKALAHLRAMILVALVQVDKIGAEMDQVPPPKRKRRKDPPHVQLRLIRGGKG